MQSSVTEFRGTSRFEVRRKLGQGGMGVVYEAFDNQTRSVVALKTLLEVRPQAIYRFKREFRALADVYHRNLVTLYELINEDDQWFFTMEMVEGRDLISWVYDLDPDAAKPPTNRETPGLWDEVSMPDAPHSEPETVPTINARRGPMSFAPRGTGVFSSAAPADLDTDRLREGLAQLAEGICALHASGHLHRDIKPSNVLVTEEPRVVLLDFGVVAEMAGDRRTVHERQLVGTPEYMAPEVVGDGDASAASDWYSVGVVLYQMLTGRRPFRGDSQSVLRQKQLGEPTPPSRIRPGIPDDLDDLCRDLLRLHPEERPTGADILRRLGREVEAQESSRRATTGTDQPPMLVGRGPHLRNLHDALDATREGRGMTLYVHGSSGMGKSALVQKFLDDAERDPRVVVLEGRCYERESVPYKAVDSLIDSLCRFLLEQPDAKVRGMLPEHAGVLARVFPVLMQVPAIARAFLDVADMPNRAELRRRAFGALRGLLAGIADTCTLILFIDDLQWGDVDSARLLEAVMHPPDAPRLLVLGCYRSEAAERSPGLQALFELEDRLGPAADVCRVEVDVLSPESARELAQSMLPGHASDLAETIARESGGNPFFIRELVEHLRHATSDPTRDGEKLTLESVIASRIAELEPPERSLIEAVAVAGRPVAQTAAQRAAGVSDTSRPALMQKLKAARFVRLSGSGDRAMVENYHDRIREIVVAALDHERLADLHLRLATEIQALVDADADAEALAAHFLAAGKTEEAQRYLVHAADLASAALAFDNAATLYESSLALGVPDSHRLAVETKHGNALFHAGRGAEAARAYRRAAQLAEGGASLELQRRAAEQFLRSGYIDEGLDTLRDVLSAVGLRMPKTPWRAIPRLLFRRAQLRLRGLGYTRRDETDVAETDRMRIDVCHSAATGLAVVDPARAAKFGTHAALLALRRGDEGRVARALALEASFVATEGDKVMPRVEQLAVVAEDIAQRLEDPRPRAYCLLMRGFAANQTGRFDDNFRQSEQARELLLSRCTGVTWETHTADLCALSALLMRGRLRELELATYERLETAQQCGDLYGVTNLRTLYLPLVILGADAPDRAMAELQDGLAQWTGQGFDLQHMFALQVGLEIDIYRGNAYAAHLRRLESTRHVRRSLLLMVQLMRGNWYRVCSNAAIAAAYEEPSRARSLLRIGNRFARKLERERSPWLSAMGTFGRALVDAARNRDELAIDRIRGSIDQFDDLEMSIHACAARYRLGQLIGGDEGAELASRAFATLVELGYANPAAACWMIAPSPRFGNARWKPLDEGDGDQ